MESVGLCILELERQHTKAGLSKEGSETKIQIASEK